MFELINSAGKGAIVFINQQNQPLSTLNRLKILKNSQTKGKVIKAPKIEMDNRDFGIGAQILHDINIHKLRLISNGTAKKRVGIIGYGLEIIDYVNY
jgi:3,4-dihydroxy 2-butanone 4-phosphate synthase/GTP cyclohydrolase II